MQLNLRNPNALFELKKIASMSWPMVLGQMLFFSVVLTDNMMVGRLGTAELAGLAAAMSLFSFFNVTSIGIFAVAAPQYAKNRQQENHDLNVDIFLSSLSVVALFSAPIGILLLFSRSILPLLGQPDITVHYAGEYFDVFAYSVPLYGLWYVFRQLTEGHGNFGFTGVSGLLTFVLNIVFNYHFIFGSDLVGGQGVRGAAIATFLVMIIVLSLHLLVILKDARLKSFRKAFCFRLPDKSAFFSFLRVGVPSGGGLAAELSFFVVGTMVVGYISYKDLAAHQIAFNMMAFLYMIPLGLAIACGVRSGEILANEGKEYLYKTVKMWTGVIAFTQVFTGLFCFFGGPFFISLYNPEPSVAKLTQNLLLITCFLLFGDGLLILFSIILRACKDTVASFYRLVFSFMLLGIPLMLLFGLSLGFGTIGVWMGKCLGIWIAALLLFFRTRTVLRQRA